MKTGIFDSKYVSQCCNKVNTVILVAYNDVVSLRLLSINAFIIISSLGKTEWLIMTRTGFGTGERANVSSSGIDFHKNLDRHFYKIHLFEFFKINFLFFLNGNNWNFFCSRRNFAVFRDFIILFKFKIKLTKNGIQMAKKPESIGNDAGLYSKFGRTGFNL